MSKITKITCFTKLKWKTFQFNQFCLNLFWNNNRFLYDRLIVTKNKPISQQKWTNEINPVNFDWQKIYSLHFKVTTDLKLLWLQYRINLRFLRTNHFCFKIANIDDNQCPFSINTGTNLEISYCQMYLILYLSRVNCICMHVKWNNKKHCAKYRRCEEDCNLLI